ncbi:MAG TPA: lytic transglycosylase domain-containing protein [Sulfuricaulis sp.]
MQTLSTVLALFAAICLTGFVPAGHAQVPRTEAAVETVPEVIDPELRVLVKQAALETDSFHDRFDGEVWLADMSQRLEKRVPDHGFRIELLKNVHYEARRADLPPELVLAVIEVESNFSQYAISVAGARGLMQVMPFWLREIGKPGDSLFRIQTNLRFGCTILKYYLQKEKGNLHAALKRYNGTRESKYSFKVDKALRTRWFSQ